MVGVTSTLFLAKRQRTRSRQRVTNIEREAMVIRLRRQGKTFDEISRELHIGKGLAQECEKRGFGRILIEADAIAMRGKYIGYLQTFLDRLYPLIDCEQPDYAAMDRALSILDRMAKAVGGTIPEPEGKGVFAQRVRVEMEPDGRTRVEVEMVEAVEEYQSLLDELMKDHIGGQRDARPDEDKALDVPANSNVLDARSHEGAARDASAHASVTNGNGSGS